MLSVITGQINTKDEYGKSDEHYSRTPAPGGGRKSWLGAAGGAV